MIARRDFSAYLSELLAPEAITDYCPNGLQVQGTDKIENVVTGVTASQALIEAAIDAQADTLLVHHGYFWKGESSAIVGMKQARVKALLENNINLYAFHLPLDVHPTLGNNAQLAEVLGLTVDGQVGVNGVEHLLWYGRLSKPLTAAKWSEHVEKQLQRKPLMVAEPDRKIETIAWCTGGAQDLIEQAASLGIDAYLTGEVSERTVHSARELDIAFYAAGHHATERYGIQALGEHVAKALGLQHQFIDIDNPV